eukprot:4619135-Pyramimonas_sp.AAC.1
MKTSPSRSSQAAQTAGRTPQRETHPSSRRPSRTAAAWKTARAAAPASGAGSAACPIKAYTSGAVRPAARASQSSTVIGCASAHAG